MMNYTPQQMRGGAAYRRGVLIGNWSEDVELAEVRSVAPRALPPRLQPPARSSRRRGVQAKKQDFEYRRRTGRLETEARKERLNRSMHTVPLTYSADGLVRFGSSVMLSCIDTEGVLCCSPPSGEVEMSPMSTFAADHPCARGVFIVRPAREGEEPEDGLVRYGDEFRLEAHPSFLADPATRVRTAAAFVGSRPRSSTCEARKTGQQSVHLTRSLSDSRWVARNADPRERLRSDGCPIVAGDALLLQHSSTGALLASSGERKASYRFVRVAVVRPAHTGSRARCRTEWGTEHEAFCAASRSGSRKSVLMHEMEGHYSEDPRVGKQFQWMVHMGAESSDDDDKVKWTVEEMSKESVFSAIRAQLHRVHDVFGLCQLRSVLRKAGVDTATASVRNEDFVQLLKDVGCRIGHEEARALCRDSDGGALLVADVMDGLCGRDMDEERVRVVDDTFRRLCAACGGDGLAVEDMHELYDPTSSDDVYSGAISAAAGVRRLLSLFDRNSDGKVTLDEFVAFYHDVSPLVEDDAGFRRVVASMWRA